MSRWGPVLLWMAGIFYFSSRPNPLGFLSSSGLSIDIGNLAHIGEYAGLAALLYRALSEEQTEGKKEKGREGSNTLFILPFRRFPFSTFSLCLLYAIFDELHQELVPGRGFELADIAYDVAGIIAALGFIWMRDHLWRKE